MEQYYTDEDLKEFYAYNPKAKKQKLISDFIKFLIIACVVCFFFSISVGFTEDFFKLVLFNSDNVFRYPWILVTNVFFHANISHLLINCWAMFMFGSFLEFRKGSKFMVILFFSSVIVSNIVFGLFNPGVSGLGISGFVYAILGSVVIFEPNTRIFIFPLPIPLKISVIGPIFLIIELVLAFVGGDGIGHIAHAVGFIVGFIISKYQKGKDIYYYK